jgi:hypothetical protein
MPTKPGMSSNPSGSAAPAFTARATYCGSQPHGHLCIITSLGLNVFKLKKIVKEFWTRACPRRRRTP